MLLLYIIMVTIVNIPIERQFIKDTKSNKYWLDYFRKSYETFTGISTATVHKELYTLEEQIERYSESLAFWYIQLEIDKTESSIKYPKDIESKRMFIKSQIVRLLNIMKDYHSSNITATIHKNAIDIKNNHLNKE